jgi:hypothetical protein
MLAILSVSLCTSAHRRDADYQLFALLGAEKDLDGIITPHAARALGQLNAAFSLPEHALVCVERHLRRGCAGRSHPIGVIWLQLFSF